jgi:hypothetical protein
MRLRNPAPGYNRAHELERNRAIELADMQNHKHGRDVEIGANGERLILTSSNGVRYEVYVDTSGALQVAEIGGNLVPNNFGVQMAELIIADTYGDTVSVVEKKKTLFKFGRNTSVGTSYETVWEYGGDETYVTTNAIDTISSSDAADTAVIYVEGHTVSGTGTDSQFTFVSQTATLNGQNKVVLGTPLARVSRAYVQSGTIAGDIYVYEDDTLSGGVPNTAANVHITIEGATSGHTQTFKAATTFSNSDYFICTGGYAGVTKKTAAAVDCVLEVRTPGGVFRPAGGRIALKTDGTTTKEISFDPPVIVPKNADMRVRAVASTTGVEVDASFLGYLAAVQA